MSRSICRWMGWTCWPPMKSAFRISIACTPLLPARLANDCLRSGSAIAAQMYLSPSWRFDLCVWSSFTLVGAGGAGPRVYSEIPSILAQAVKRANHSAIICGVMFFPSSFGMSASYVRVTLAESEPRVAPPSLERALRAGPLRNRSSPLHGPCDWRWRRQQSSPPFQLGRRQR